MTVYQGVECEELYDEVKVEQKERYREQIEGQICPDMADGGMRLRSNLKDTWSVGAEIFHFAIDTCENFKVFTGSKSCQPNTVVEPIINSFIAINKIQQQFFSAKTYVSNDMKLSSEFIQRR